MILRIIRPLLTLFLTLALAAGRTKGAEAELRMETAALSGAIEGKTTNLKLGGMILSELPPDFVLNPNLIEDERSRARIGLPFTTKAVTLLASSRRVDGDDISVRLTPIIGEEKTAGILVTCTVHETGERPASKPRDPVSLTSTGAPAVFILGGDGRVKPNLAGGWSLLIALQGRAGLICWNAGPDDAVIRPYPSGFRRFQLEGPPNSEGWQLLKPLGQRRN